MLSGYKMFKVVVVDIDYGTHMTSITAKTGKRIFSVLMETKEAVKASLEKDREAYCLVRGKDITMFRDYKYFLNNFISQRKVVEEKLFKEV